MKQEQIKGKSCIHVTRYNVPYSILIYVISYSVRQLSHIFLFLGNSYLSQLTGCDSYKLRVILTDTEGQSKNADYSYFKVDGPDFKYSLHISGYSGTAGNYLYCIMWYVSWTNIYVAWKWYLSHLPINHDRDKFSTKDNDNDSHKDKSVNCATMFKGGWWCSACHFVNLNGLYLNGTYTEYVVGKVWNKWKGYQYSFMKTKMMMRRN